MRAIALFATLCLLSGTALAQEDAATGRNEPIEITADRLDVDQGTQLAVFRGDVDAVQGDMVLHADVLRVAYGGEGGDGAGSIRRIEAEGSVVLSSPTESAEGERGTYDVVAGLVTLEGGVSLLRGDNVIRGSRLEYEVDTGRARVFADGVDGAQGRVRALFTPENGQAADN